MFPAAVRALHAADLTAEGLQGVQDPRVHGQYGGVAVGKSLILAELGGRRRTGIVILGASKQIINGSSGTSRGSRGTCGTSLSRGSLWIKKKNKKNWYVQQMRLIRSHCKLSDFWVLIFLSEKDVSTSGPDSPEIPRVPGGPIGPGAPLYPSFPEGPIGPGGPCFVHQE